MAMSRLGRKLIRGLREGRSVWELYKNKPLHKRLWAAIYHSDILDPLFNIYYSVVSFIKNVKRLIEYAPLVWQHRNWDYGFVLKFQKKLYEDLYKGCYVDGCHVFKKKEAQKLKTVIALIDRLHKDEYDHWHYDYLDKKFGKEKIGFEPIPGTENKPGGPYSRMTSRADNMNEEQKKIYITERKRMWALEEAQRKQDMELLAKLVTRQSRKWWD